MGGGKQTPSTNSTLKNTRFSSKISDRIYDFGIYNIPFLGYNINNTYVYMYIGKKMDNIKRKIADRICVFALKSCNFGVHKTCPPPGDSDRRERTTQRKG